MALKAILTAEEHSSIGESFKSEYVEKDGKFYLDVAPVDGYALEDVGNLKTSLGKERTHREKLEKEVVKFKDLDPDRARAALAELEELKKIDPDKEADKIANAKFEAARSQLLTKHEKELADEQAKSTKYRNKIDELLRDQRATIELANQKGSIELLLPHIRSQTRVVEDGDDFKLEVIDSSGNVRIGNSKGEPMSLEDLILEMRNSDKFGRAFEGDGKSGSGKLPGTGHGGTPGLKRSQMSPAQKREFQQKHGQEAFLKLPK